MTEPIAFDVATAVTREEASPSYAAHVPASWATGVGMHGGVLATVLLRAARAELDDDELVLRSASVSFRNPPSSFDLVIDPVVARRGGLTAHVDVTARSIDQAEPAAAARVLFARRRDAAGYSDAQPPAVPTIEQCAGRTFQLPANGPLPTPPIFEHLELIETGSSFPWQSDWRPGPAHYQRWNRYRAPVASPGGRLDPLLLVPFADFPAAAVWVRFSPDEPMHFVTSLELTMYFLEDPRDEAVLADIRARVMHDGYVMTETDLWSAGRLVATSTQLMLARPGPAPADLQDAGTA
jgi:acyl-CoA thioesterase